MPPKEGVVTRKKERGGFPGVCRALKRDRVIVQPEQPTIGDGYTMCITAEVFQRLSAASSWLEEGVRWGKTFRPAASAQAQFIAT